MKSSVGAKELAESQQACTKNDEREPDSVADAPSHEPLLVELIWVPSLFRHPSAASYPTVDLAVLKQMTQELAELLGLLLPESRN